ncbi:MAG: DUF885 domain-containing protein, partial [Pseudomonadota bacterium]
MTFDFFRALVTSTALIAASPLALGQSLDQIIDRYEAFDRAGDPEEAAKANGEEARSWHEVSPRYIYDRAQTASQMLAALEPLDGKTRGPELPILRHLLTAHINAHEYDTARIPFTGDWGFFAAPNYTAMRTRLNTRAKAEAWIDRLEDLPRYFDQQTENMRRGIATGWTQHSDPLSTSIAQIRAQIVDDPFESTLFLPFESLSASELSDAEILLLKNKGRTAVSEAIEAYVELLDFMELEYAPAARAEPGLVSLEGGREAYAVAVAFHTAGAGYAPEEIHRLGQAEVARIRAEMDAVIEDLAFEGTFEDFIAFLRTDPQFYAETPEQLLEKASEMSKRLDAILPRYFKTLPRLPYGVEAVPAAIAPGYTTGRYSGGDADKGIARTYLVNTYALDQRPLYELP